MKIKIKDIAKICNGKYFGNGECEVSSFFTDSRQAIDNAMFIPIVGDNIDAHKFIPQVLNSGSASFSQKQLECEGDYVLVDNNIKALQELALYYRNSFNIPFIGITGSVGKTTTKEMISLALESEKKVHKTMGNANSQIGLPITILKTEADAECAVIEMGMSMPGEMEKLSYCAKVDMAVITNIGVSHIENLGSRENILKAKMHIIDHFTENNILFVNGDDDLLSTLKGTTNFKVVEFGLNENCDFRAIDIIEDENGTKFTCLHNGMKTVMYVPVAGIHNVRNALASLAIAVNNDVSIDSAVNAISKYVSPNMRQEIKKNDYITIIDDTYNASPDSMKASLDVLTKLKGKRKIALLADMLELGAYSVTGHKEVGECAKKLNIDYLIAFGPESINIYNGFNDNENSVYFADFDSVKDFLIGFIKKDDIILIKGSRGMKTDRFVKILEELN